MTVISLALLAIGIGLLRFARPTHVTRYLAGAATALSLFWLAFYHAADAITGRGVDESVFYHLRVGLHGAGFEDFASVIAASCAAIIGIAGATFLVVRATQGGSAPTRYSVASAGLAFMTLSIALSPATGDVYAVRDALVGPSHSAPLGGDVPAGFHVPSAQSPKEPKNVVYLYLESLEGTYFDSERFPGLMPNLSRLQSEAVTFEQIGQAPATGWTVGGMVASQCGVPLFSSSHQNSLGALDRFLPRAECLGDILADEGYELHYMGGASTKFAGKGKFLRSHGFSRIDGLGELKSEVDDPKYYSYWGLHDDSLYEAALERFDELSEQENPFGLFLLTLDTHHPSGSVTRDCGDLQYGDGSNDMLNAVHCADFMAAKFIEAIRARSSADDTVIVVSSDHLAMKNTAYERLEAGSRNNLLMIFDGSQETGTVDDTPGTTLDIAPTVLNAVDVPVDGVGFGRDLRSGTTLREEKEDFPEYLRSKRQYVSSLWDYPQFEAGVRLAENGNRLVLGEREVEYPVAFLLDEEAGSVESVMFAHTSHKSLREKLAERSEERPFVWVDQCQTFRDGGYATAGEPADACYASGKVGDETFRVHPISSGQKITKRELVSPIRGDRAAR